MKEAEILKEAIKIMVHGIYNVPFSTVNDILIKLNELVLEKEKELKKTNNHVVQ